MEPMEPRTFLPPERQQWTCASPFHVSVGQTTRGGNDSTFNISATAGDAELVLEAVPDFEQTSVELEICALRVRDVGDGLACMLHKNPLAVTQLSKSSASRWAMQTNKRCMRQLLKIHSVFDIRDTVKCRLSLVSYKTLTIKGVTK